MIKKILKRIRYYLLWIVLYHKFEHVGKHSVIKKPLLVKGGKNIYIGDNVYALQGLRLEIVDHYNNEKFTPHIHIGDGCTFSQYAEILATDDVYIGDNVSIGQFAMVNTTIHGYMEKDVPIIKQDLIHAPIRIGEGTSIGMGACILPGANIGKYCYIGANCVVNKKIPDYTIVSPQKPRMATLPYGRED